MQLVPLQVWQTQTQCLVVPAGRVAKRPCQWRRLLLCQLAVVLVILSARSPPALLWPGRLAYSRSWPGSVRPTAHLLTKGSPCRTQTEGSIAARAVEDPHRWLEQVDSPQALAWVEAQNNATLQAIGDPRSGILFNRLLDTETTDVGEDPLRKLPQVTKIGDLYYDFWSDARFPRGVWRRATLAEFTKSEPSWEVILSLDELGSAEGESWVWRGYALLDEGPDTRRAMLQLSRGGADAVVAREFDLEEKAFVPPEEGGFV
ncbi:unnamed protein product [Prorocentrum cordatum]|uniref:Peptidase S9A N-terminal domain-containing protein n=1 Tax=Prorocentrum cordatum TaxID=2364126 RepID=A0ABN9X6Y1_9DINO|nr:unnamed protein product [Polarella glacialis]